MTLRITRRAFIGLGVITAAGGIALERWRWRSDSSSVSAPGLAAFFSDSAAARRIGRAYLDGSAPSRSPDRLAERAAPRRSRPEAWLRSATRKQIAEELDAQTRADFEADRVVSVTGWQLAESEAALCAYYDLAVA